MRYDKILRTRPAGIYAAPRLIGPLRAAAKSVGIAWLDLDLAGVASRDAFLQRCAEVFSLPDHFGRNWDALHECMLDFAGTGSPGAVVHWRRGAELARRAPDAVTTALEILGDAARYWSGSGRIFIVVVDRDSAPGMALSPLR
jgi:RNAse (barnase) inhibitor barstar